jgi:molecular chaperone DnaK
VRGQEYTLPEISAFVRTRAKEIAERALGETVERAVITVPANFNELQRAATKVAGRVAGLDVMRIINEPTAAALAYGLGRSTKERIAVYDFGGGTFDCTLLDLSGNVFEALATAGDSFLGGDDLDVAIAERMAEAFLQTYRYDPRVDPQAFERLRAAAEAVKVELSTSERSQSKVRDVAIGGGGAHLDLDFGMTRDELEMLAAPLVERTFAVCQEALGVAKLPVSAFDKVILVGGSTRVPLVRRRVEQFFGSAPLDRVNADEVVAIGAAIQAAALTEVGRRTSIPAPPVPAARKSFFTEPDDDEVTAAHHLPSKLAELERMRPSSPDIPVRRTQAPPTAVQVPSITATLPLVVPLPQPPTLPTTTPGPTLPTGTPGRTQPIGPPRRRESAEPPPNPADTIPRPVSFQDILRSTIPPEGPAAPASGPPPGTSASGAPPPAGSASGAPSPAGSASGAPGPVARSLPRIPVLVDVTPRALVVETVGGWCDVVVQRNAKIPCERTRAFTTSGDMQTVVRVRVAQGEDPLFEKNTYLGEVELVGLRPARRGEVTIRARFEVDESGTLKVFATDVATGREAHALLQLVGIAESTTIAAMQQRHAATRIN